MRPLLLLLPLLAACAPPEPAPEDIEDLMLFTFRHYEADEGTNARSLADAGKNLLTFFDSRSWIDEDSNDPDADFEAGFEATVERLTHDESDLLDPEPEVNEPEAAVGVLVARWQDCTLQELDDIYMEADQGRLFPENYVSYERTRFDDRDCYAGGDCNASDWEADIIQEQNVIGTTYTYDMTLASGIRRFDAIPASDDITAPKLEGRVSRTWLTNEAQIEPSDFARFYQNYQIEIMVPSGSGLVHFYAQWTHLEAGVLNTEAAVFLNSYLEGMFEYLDDMESNCGGR